MRSWMDSTLLVILCSALITPSIWHVQTVTPCHILHLMGSQAFFFFSSCTGSTHLPRPCKARVKGSVRPRASRGAGRPGAPARLWLKIPSTALLTQHKNVDSRGPAAAPTVIKITDSTRLNSSFFGGFYFLWSARSHLPRFISPLGHATNLQSGGSVFLSSVVSCSCKSIKNKNSSANCITTVHSGRTRTLQRLSFVFWLFAAGQLTACVWFKMKGLGFFKPAGLGGSRHRNSIISDVWPLKVTLVVLCHLHSLVRELALHVSILTFGKKKEKDLKQKLLFSSWNWVRLILCWFTLRNIKPTKNNWASQCAPFHRTLNNIGHCRTLIVCCTNLQATNIQLRWMCEISINFWTVLLPYALITFIFS